MKKHLFYLFCILSMLYASCGDDDKLQDNVNFKGLSLKNTKKALEGEWTDPTSSQMTEIITFTGDDLEWRKFELEDIYGYSYFSSSTAEIRLPVNIQDGILTIAINNWANPLPLNSENVIFYQLIRIK
ncbi:MAG: hypothetical protein LUH22_07425 [Bacteroides sp.]|nr:hypothetical protein [Bacteroides sp.]